MVDILLHYSLIFTICCYLLLLATHAADLAAALMPWGGLFGVVFSVDLVVLYSLGGW